MVCSRGESLTHHNPTKMKKILALAAAALTATTLVGCGELDPNAIKITFAGDHIGYYHCKTDKFQPALGNQAGLNSNHWHEADEFLAAALVKSDVLEEAGLLGGLGAAFFTSALFEKGSELCAEEGLGQDKSSSVAQSPVIDTAPVFQPTLTYETSIRRNNSNTDNIAVQARQSVIPNGKAMFVSGSTGKEELIGVVLASRVNLNGHTVYDAKWSDGYESSYVFWSNRHAEIFSKDGAGSITRTDAKFERQTDGSLKIIADTNSVTIFPSFNPATN